MKRKFIKTVLLIILVLLAIVLGLVIGNVCENVKGLSWLATFASFGLKPSTLDLSALQLTFGLTVHINVAQIILLLGAIITYCCVRIKE